ncbi:hypothetical protein B0H13DRAFT_2359685 [Mycena leptocephala]|nr:hypothetical protein B0H13DRAFT_2359685 [Mycena leptocephala]
MDPTNADGIAPAETSWTERESEIEKLANIVRASLQKLQKTHVEQSKSLKAVLDRFSTAIEAQTEQSQSSDKTAVFWTSYKKLADEFDGELQKRYGNDLDTSLIFTGIFSALVSQFIFAVQSSSDTVAVVTETFLYVALFSSLFAALVAVLGKQWLQYYDSVGERGTIAERGNERQRKFDSLQRWHFAEIIQLPSLLLQLSLFQFAVALSMYLWTQNDIRLAVTAIVLTSLGSVIYILMILSVLVSPDSPFQSPLTNFLLVHAVSPHPRLQTSLRRSLTTLNETISFSKALQIFMVSTRGQQSKGFQSLRPNLSRARSSYSRFMNAIPSVLPLFHARSSPTVPMYPTPNFQHIPQPSPEAHAIIWALETSTDPRVVENAAAAAIAVQFPLDIDLRPSFGRLLDVFVGCFSGNRLREGMGDRALHCVKAMGMLQLVDERVDSFVLSDCIEFMDGNHDGGLDAFIALVCTQELGPRFSFPENAHTQWTLRLVSRAATKHKLSEADLHRILISFQPDEPTLRNRSVFADFLFCLNSVFSHMTVHDLAIMDKSQYCVLLTTALFKNLATRATNSPPLDSEIVDGILGNVLRFTEKITFDQDFHLDNSSTTRNAMYDVVTITGLKQAGSVAALQLVRVAPGNLDCPSKPVNPYPIKIIAWVYGALKQLWASQSMHIDVVGDLLQVLVHYGPVQTMANPDALRTILWAVTSEASPGAAHRTPYFASRVILSAHDWFQDNTLRPVLLEGSAWSLLGAHTDSSVIPTDYISLGNKISQTPEWRLVVSQELPTWLLTVPTLLEVEAEDQTREEFCSVSSRVWDVNQTESDRFTKEDKVLFIAFTLLANLWEKYSLSDPQDIRRLVQCMKCTAEIAFCAQVSGRMRSTKASDSIERSTICLGNAIAKVVIRVQADTLAAGAIDILSRLATAIQGELRNGAAPDDEEDREENQRNLLVGFKVDIEALSQSGGV